MVKYELDAHFPRTPEEKKDKKRGQKVKVTLRTFGGTYLFSQERKLPKIVSMEVEGIDKQIMFRFEELVKVVRAEE